MPKTGKPNKFNIDEDFKVRPRRIQRSQFKPRRNRNEPSEAALNSNNTLRVLNVVKEKRNLRQQNDNKQQYNIDLTKLLENSDVDDSILEILDNRKKFSDFSKTNLNEAEIVVVIKLLGKVCQSPYKWVKREILSIFLNDPFTGHLDTTIEKNSKRAGHFWNDSENFWQSLVTICENIAIAPTFGYNTVQTFLRILTVHVPVFEAAHELKISEGLKDKLFEQLSLKENEVKFENSEEPNDFRQIPIYPSPLELLKNDNSLSPNVIKGPYEDIDHYLNVQFRLLREDFLGPLRNEIRINYYKSDSSVEVTFLKMKPINENYCIRLSINLSKDEFRHSRKFMFGGLVCFTRDDFRSVIFGKICERNLEKGKLTIEFDQDVPIVFNAEYIMVESKINFEPYFHVLSALKSKTEHNFPMEKYIIRLEFEIQPPKYLLDSTCTYKIQNQKFSPLRNWPTRNIYNLNESQFLAFKAALTQEFAVIRGPSGTGKTYLGLQIVKTLLRNRHCWHKRSPILVICSTDHTLDKFLEGVLQFSKQIIRAGGRSTTETLEKFCLKGLGRIRNRSVWNKLAQLKEIAAELKDIDDWLKEIDGYQSVVDFHVFDDVLPSTWFYQARNGAILDWLLGARKNMAESQHQATNSKSAESDTIDGLFIEESDISIVTLKSMVGDIKTLEESLAKLDPNKSHATKKSAEINAKLSTLRNKFNYLRMRLAEGRQSKNIVTKPKNTDLIHPKNMKPDDRWSLYFHWLKLYKNKLLEKSDSLNDHYREIYKNFLELRDLETTKYLQQALVVGITTTRAARLRTSLQSLKSPIIIVEEAAKILEAHIVASVSEHCQHLILIGDHQQFRPKTADFNIGTKFKLGVSLFERMISNGVHYHDLNVQYRMRPEISSLISPIYPSLEDHVSVTRKPPIRGLDKSVFFIDHDHLETESVRGVVNHHEIRFFVNLAKYLVLNDHQPSKITILTAYLAQMYTFQKEIGNHEDLKTIRIAVLDNYQGEESDIVLLSLVRNNNEKKIGFLSNENRICVALSRAKDGFYIMGNMAQLCGDSDLWAKVRAALQEQDAVGPDLPLRCQVHHDVVTYVKSDTDFMAIQVGGCDQNCGGLLTCGHGCNLPCHIRDREHTDYHCDEECNRRLCNDHTCPKKCHEKCGPCTTLVQRILRCGHETEMECQKKFRNYDCPVILTTQLPCGHTTQKPCHRDPDTFPCPHPCEKKINCGHDCGLSCHIRTDPDHLKYKCRKRCARYCRGCTTKDQHRCRKLCYEECPECTILVKKQRTGCAHFIEAPCSVVDDTKCEERCTKILKCGHPCKKRCHEECEGCNVKVNRTLPVCGHILKVKCSSSESPDRKYCNKKCPLKLPCGHLCNSKCNEPCTANCAIMVTSRLLECGHIGKIECHKLHNPAFDQDSKLCNESCDALLKCGHVCSGSCSECYQGRIHKKCKLKCGTDSLICVHQNDLSYRRSALKRKLFLLSQKCCPKIIEALEVLESQLKTWITNNQSVVYKCQLEALMSKLHFIECLINICWDRKVVMDAPEKCVLSQINFIVDILQREQTYITSQEMDDLASEINRFLRIVEFSQIRKSQRFVDDSSKDEVKQAEAAIRLYVSDLKKFSKTHDEDVYRLLNQLNQLVSAEITISKCVADLKICSMEVETKISLRPE